MQRAALWSGLAVACLYLAVAGVDAQYGPPVKGGGKKHRTTTTTTEPPGGISNDISGPFPISDTGPFPTGVGSAPGSYPPSGPLPAPGSGGPGSYPPSGPLPAPGSAGPASYPPSGSLPGPGSAGPASFPPSGPLPAPGPGAYPSSQPGGTPVPDGSGDYWWKGPNSPFKPGSQPQGPLSPPPSYSPPPPGPQPNPSSPGCGGTYGCASNPSQQPPLPSNPSGKPVDIAQNPFLSSAILGKPLPSSPGCQGAGGSCQYPGQGAGPTQYPGQPLPGPGTGPTQYPSQPTGSGSYPGQPSGPAQYPGAKPFPNQGAVGPAQYPRQPAGSSPFPGQAVVPLRPQCSASRHACVPSSMCVGGVITPNGLRQMQSPEVKECIPGLEACCRIPPGGPGVPGVPGSPVSPGGPGVPGGPYPSQPGYGGSTQRPYLGPLNTTPHPGCAAALKCVAETFCTAEGVMSNTPVFLTREQADNKVPLTDCQDPDTGIIGKCCRDPNYKDPWPAGMMMKNPGDFDDGQYHGEGSGPAVNIGPIYNSISSTPHTPSKDHGAKPSDRPGGFNKPFPAPFPGNSPAPGSPQPSGFYQPGQPSGTPYQPGKPYPYQPSQPQPIQPSGSQYQPGQPTPTGPSFQPGQPSPGSPSYQPGQPSPTGQSYQPGQPIPTGQSYQPGQPIPTGQSYQPGQPSPSGPSYQPGQPSPTGQSYQPGQPIPTGQSYQPGQPIPTGSSYQPGQPIPTGPISNQPEPIPDQQPDYNLPTHPGQNQPSSGNEPQDQGPAPGSSCGIRRPGPPGDVAGFAEFPWQALVMSAGNRSLLCGAAIIAENAVITAAHCVNQLRGGDLLVKAGEWKLLGQNPRPTQVRPVVAVARHPAYNSGSLAKDLSILVLEQPFVFDIHVDKICIPPVLGPEYFQKPGQQCVLTGWGKNALSGPIQNSELHKIPVEVIPAKQCEAELKTSQNLGKYFILNEGFSCARPPNPTDLCKVDFGSAVACAKEDGHYELAGVSSWDIACPTKQPLPSVFATSDAQWIETVLSTPLPVLQEQEKTYIQGLLQGESIEGVDTDDKPGFSQGYGK